MRKLLRALCWGLGAFGFLTLASIAAAFWSPQLVAAVVTTINGSNGSFTTGGGLTVNQPWLQYFFAPWFPYVTNNNVITQSTGPMNALRNPTMTAMDHYRYMTSDAPLSNPYNIGIAQFQATIDNGAGASGNLLTVASSPTPTGTPQLFQRITDEIDFNTTGATAVPTVASPTCINAATSCVLQFAAGTVGSVASGMYVVDNTAPRAIAGNIKVQSVNNGAGTVTLTAPVGYGDNNMGGSGGLKLIAPGVGIGDQIGFSTVLRGTMIVGGGTCAPTLNATPTYPCNYVLNNSQQVGSETMQSAGGWAAEGIYVIPVGTAGTSNFVACSTFLSTNLLGTYNPQNVHCLVTGSLTDLIIRFPMDYIDAAKINCSDYSGGPQCVSTNMFIQPLTFQLMATFGPNYTSVPSLDTKIACPLNGVNGAGLNSCADVWTNTTTDLSPVTFSGASCTNVASPQQCQYAYTWTPTGIHGGMEINFHTGNMSNNQFININGFELKMTPGATCGGASPPCVQLYPGQLELPEVETDLLRNKRLAQTIGPGASSSWNGGSGALEMAPAFVVAGSTTHFMATWPLTVGLKCPVWDSGTKAAPTCPKPNVYFPASVSDYKFENGAAEFVATALSVAKLGMNSIVLDATSSGMTAAQPGYAQFGAAGKDLILIDSSYLNFGD